MATLSITYSTSAVIPESIADWTSFLNRSMSSAISKTGFDGSLYGSADRASEPHICTSSIIREQLRQFVLASFSIGVRYCFCLNESKMLTDAAADYYDYNNKCFYERRAEAAAKAAVIADNPPVAARFSQAAAQLHSGRRGDIKLHRLWTPCPKFWQWSVRPAGLIWQAKAL